MKKHLTLLAGVVMAALAAAPSAVLAAGPGVAPPMQDWSFSGPFGKFDRGQLQRGFQVYREVCASCHGIEKVAFRNLAEPGGPQFSVAQIQALAAEYQVRDGPNDAGDMFDRPGRLADRFPNPFPNKKAAAAANNGKAPPDLSVMAKARTYQRGFPWFITDVFVQYTENGPDYLKALLVGYVDPPAGFQVPDGGNFNRYYPGNIIAMPNVLADGQVTYGKGPDGKPVVPETVDQYARDVTAFLMWTAEPHLEARKRLGFQVMIFLLVLAGLLYFTKKRIWARIGHETEGRAAS